MLVFFSRFKIALLRQIIGRQTAQNLKLYFENNNLDFIDEMEISLPVTQIIDG